jgi:hypothetical protein
MLALFLPFRCLLTYLRSKPGACIRCHDTIVVPLTEKSLIEAELEPERRYCDECEAVRHLEREANESAMNEMFGYTYD